MDAALTKRFEEAAAELPEGTHETGITIKRMNDATGEINLLRGDQSETYTLKPLGELYGPGPGGTVDPKNDAYMPLFLAVEREITRFDMNEESLTDGRVALVLSSLAMNPEAPSADELGTRIQGSLRLNLSMNNFSRQELRQVLRKVEKSVARHTESGRGRGYVDFIRQFFGAREELMTLRARRGGDFSRRRSYEEFTFIDRVN